MAQSLFAALEGLYSACQAAFASSTAGDGSPVFVSFGDPGQYQPQAIVAVMDAAPSQNVDRPTLGTNRSRQLDADISVMFSVYTPGGNEAHQTSIDQVAVLVRTLEDYLRASPNEKLGGACWDSWVSAIAGPAGTIVYDPAMPEVPTGRVVEATATVTVRIRY